MTFGRNFQIIKLLLFGGVITLLALRLNIPEISDLNSFRINPFTFIFALILVPLNWFMEFLKWKFSLDAVNVDYSKSQLKQSFFAGIVTGMLTPNMLGNFIGRIYYFQRKSRVQITLITLMSNFAQFLPSIFFGIIAFWFLGFRIFPEYSFVITISLLAIFGVSLFSYFNFDRILIFLRKKKSYPVEFSEVLKHSVGIKRKLLLLSFFRHVIFSLQFVLILVSFGAELTIDIFLNIWLVYLITTLIPSLFLGKLGIRESVSLFVLSAIGVSDLIIICSSLLIWFSNLLLPSLFGLIICKKGIPA